MTAAPVATDTPTVEQRRVALIALAEEINLEDRFPSSAPFIPVVREWVTPLCGWPLRGDPDLAFNVFGQLVGAVADLSRFTSNETDWLHAHDLPATDAMRDATDARLRSDVDTWAERLVSGRASS